MQLAIPAFWHNRNFAKLWFGQTVSLFGSNITLLALPLAAATQLAATPVQMGIMQSAQYLPFLLFGLLAGVWVDRMPRRPVMLAADLGRALALAVVPVAAWGGWLSMPVLYAVTFVMGTLNLFFEAAYAAILPALVPANELARGNSKLQTSAAIAEIAGPGLAGWLVGAVTAAGALLGDAASFLVSACALGWMQPEEPARAAVAKRESLWRELRAGLGAVLNNPYVRPLTLCSASANLFINMHLACIILYLTREIALSPAQIGLIFSAGSVGGLLGALVTGRATRRIGVGNAVIGESLAVGVAAILIPLASTTGALALPLLALLQAFWGFWLPLYVVNAASLRQLTTPTRLLGRVTASSRFISWGAAAVGFVLGGVVAEQIGLFTTLLVASAGLLLSAAWVIWSPLRGLRELPAPLTEA